MFCPSSLVFSLTTRIYTNNKENFEHTNVRGENETTEHKNDRYRCTVLAYENHRRNSEEARKFLEEFGILGPMGNGVTAVRHKPSQDPLEHLPIRKTTNSKSPLGEDYDYLKSVVSRLKEELSDLEIKYAAAQTELVQTHKQLECKESEVVKLQREVHKLKVSARVGVFPPLLFCFASGL